MQRLAALLLCATVLTGDAAHAQQGQPVVQYRTVHFLSGTGFFVNNDGYVVTNHHVVTNCKDLTVSGAVREAKAKIVNADAANDLALLKTDAYPPAVAELRDEHNPIAAEDTVFTVGFPGQLGLTTREARMVDTKGPGGEAQWIQFTDSVQQGNSGGPLLDSSGYVVGVIMAKAQIYRINQEAARKELVRKADIAISLPLIKQFLERNNVRYRQNVSGGLLAWHRVEDKAKQYIVNVKCEQ